MKIENPNSSGQGYCPEHSINALHEIVTGFGYLYSHSVYITMMDGRRVLHHCYKHSEHNVSFPHSEIIGSVPWETSCSCASGHKHHGWGADQLHKHLKGKARRYSLQKP